MKSYRGLSFSELEFSGPTYTDSSNNLFNFKQLIQVTKGFVWDIYYWIIYCSEDTLHLIKSEEQCINEKRLVESFTLNLKA